MGIKDVFNQAPTPEEEALYKQVLDEVESGVMRKGIYAKALADGLGDVGKAQSLYIKYRVQSLIDEERRRAELIASERKAMEEKARKDDKVMEARKKADAKIEAEYDWKHNTHWFVKFVIFPIIFVILWFLLIALLGAIGIIDM